MWNPPALTATEEGQHEDSVTTQPIGANDGGPSRFGADTMFSFSPFTSSGDHPELKNQIDRVFLDLNCSTDFMTGANSTNVKNNTSEFNRQSDFSIPGGNDNDTSDCSMSFMLPWCPGAGYPIKANGAEAKTSRISSSMGNISVTGNNNNNNDDDINAVPRTYSSPRDVNGDFLSLGIGSGTEIKSNSNFSTREIASKLGDPVSASSQNKSSMVGQSPWNLDLVGLASADRNNGGGLSRPTLTGSSRLNPIQFPCVGTQQANPQYDNFLIDLTQPSSSSSPSGIPIISQRECAAQTLMGPQIARPTSHGSQFVPRQQQYGRRSYANASSESSRNNLSDSLRGSSISHAQLGTLTPLTEARQSVAGGRFPGGVRYRGGVQPLGNFTSQVASTNTGVAYTCPSPASFQPVVHSGTSCNLGPVAVPGNSLLPQSFGIPIPRASNIQSGAAGPFPRRLGVQPNDPTVRSIRGTPAIRLPAQYPVRPLLPSGPHHHGMPAQLPTGFPRADYSSGIRIPSQAYPFRPLVSSGQFSPVAKHGVRPSGTFVPHPHLKRQATENPSTGLVSQRRKISHQPVVIRHPVPVQRPSFPAPIPGTSRKPAAHHHIKCQLDIEEPLEPSGYKCLLCKRDISFTAEGPVNKPAIPPAVAVLACGHTFHEDCLQRITPEDYSIDPPCIPCALGET